MSLFKSRRKSALMKLERQQHLAKFEPSNVVDYSDCSLEEIPSGTYTLCNLWLKEVLLLHTNRLRTLKEDGSYEGLCKLQQLRVLDLHANVLIEVPTQFGFLKNLQVLNLECNNLQKLCPEICTLSRLQTLNVRKNKISTLPDDIGSLQSLRTLDVSDNKLTSLPLSLARVQCLEALILNQNQLVYPSKDICGQGTAAVLRFLCAENGHLYVPCSAAIVNLLQNPRTTINQQQLAGGSSSPHSSLSNGISPVPGMSHSCENLHLLSPSDTNDVSKAINSYEAIKEQKRLHLAKLQKDMLQQCEKEALLVTQSNAQRNRLINSLEKENIEISEKIKTLTDKKHLERQTALEELRKSEIANKNIVESMLFEHEENKRRELAAELQAKRSDEETKLNTCLLKCEDLRKAEIRAAMEDQIRELCAVDYLLKVNEDRRKEILQKVINIEMSESENIAKLLRSKEMEMQALIESIVSDEKLQKQAVLMLMQQKDDRMLQINKQLLTIQEELVKLTVTEMENRDMRDRIIQEQLTMQRNELIRVMDVLVKERDRRNSELRETLIELEKQRLEEQADYWLVQYQRLLDMKPDNLNYLEKALDEDVKNILIQARATIYLPLFAKKQITSKQLQLADEHFLERLGVSDVQMRQSINRVSRQFFTARSDATAGTSEPVSTQEWPSTGFANVVVKAHFEFQCVICMDRQSSIVFMPCGHVCCCTSCESLVDSCPMCRRIIEQKVDLTPNIALT